MKPALKICGMKYNTDAVADLAPAYLGFIFYEGSKRNFEGPMPVLPEEIQKVGVFVQASVEEILEKVHTYSLNVVQLHGGEDETYVAQLREALPNVKLWKVFHVGETFNFAQLHPFEPLVDAFLLDTQGKTLGGTGKRFNWKVLQHYASSKPLVLSGGIGPEHLSAIQELMTTYNLPIHAIDVNSRFEVRPGEKDTTLLKQFKDGL